MTPAARIEVNGEEMSTLLVNEAGGLLISVAVNDEAGGRADSLEFTIDDHDGFASAEHGDEVRVWLGYEPEPAYMGRFKVETIRKSGPRRVMSVEAKAADLMGAIRAPRARSWHEKSVGEIATVIAAEHGLRPMIAPEVASVRIPHIDQQTESDLAFLARLAGQIGALFKVADGGLLMARRGAKLLPSGLETPSITLRPEDVESWDWAISGRADFKAVTCRHRDLARGGYKFVTAGDATSASKWRDRRLYGSREEAEMAARSKLDAFQRGRLTMDIESAVGLPAAFAGCEVTLVGFDADIDGAYFLDRVRHIVDGRGFRSSLTLSGGSGDSEPPGP